MESPDISAFAYSYQKNLEICLKHMEDLIKNRAYILHNKGLYTDALKFTKATEGRLRQTWQITCCCCYCHSLCVNLFNNKELTPHKDRNWKTVKRYSRTFPTTNTKVARYKGP